jgi:hypothetical protein
MSVGAEPSLTGAALAVLPRNLSPTFRNTHRSAASPSGLSDRVSICGRAPSDRLNQCRRWCPFGVHRHSGFQCAVTSLCCPLAHAIMRERTQALTSDVGSIGSTWP